MTYSLSNFDSTLVPLLSRAYGFYTGRCNSVLGRNTLLCCLHFEWKFSDFVHSNIDLSLRHRGLVSDSDWHAVCVF